MQNFIIRKITEADRAAFLTMSRDFYLSDAVLHPVPDEFHERAFDEMMRSSHYLECFIFTADDSPVGFGLIAKTYSREAGGMALWVEELYLTPPYRGMGIGTQFFKFLENNYCPARFRLEAEKDNARAIALYEKMGYRPLQYVQLIKGE